MSKLFGIVFGSVVFCLFFTLIFEIGNNINEGYNVTVSSTYSEKTSFYSDIEETARGEVLNISDKSPGGNAGSIGGTSEDTQVGGLRAMAQIFQAPNNLKKIIIGDETHTGIAGMIGVDYRIVNVAIACISFIVALILIGAILKNRI